MKSFVPVKYGTDVFLAEDIIIMYSKWTVLKIKYTDRSCRNLVNSYSSEWSFSYTGVPQGSLLSALIFPIFTADMTTEEVEQLEAIPQESKYADDFNIWRIAKYFYSLLIQIQIAIKNLQSLCKKWQIEKNPIKTKYMVFHNKKKLLPPPSLKLTKMGCTWV